MNPRHRRLLIPGLLVVLLAIVVITSLTGRADGAVSTPDQVSTLSDPRINESSGLVVSREDADLAYTMNDSGGAPVIYAIRISTGETIATTTIDADFVDTEALSIDDAGTLWIADTGDNNSQRTDVALYSLPEPGATDQEGVSARRFPITYPGGPLDVEALVVQPGTGSKYLISKGLFGGTVFSLPERLVEDQPNEAVAMAGEIPGLVTDAAFAVDGEYVVARDYSEAFVLDAVTWTIVSSTDLPSVDQGETLAMEPAGDSYLVGSEGTRSPLYRVPFASPAPDEATAPTPVPTQRPASAPAAAGGFAGGTWFWAALVVGLLAVISLASTRKG